METISKASINTCSPYTILSKETSEVKEIVVSTNVRYVHLRHSLRGKHGRNRPCKAQSYGKLQDKISQPSHFPFLH